MHIVLYFTKGLSLKTWDQIGMLSREVALYQRLQDLGNKITFITYGNSEELAYSQYLQGIEICCNRFNLPGFLYKKLITRLHRPTLEKCDLIKTNQTDGAEIALKAALRFNKPLIARCGYMWSEFMDRQYGHNSFKAQKAHNIEGMVFSKASKIIVTTSEMKKNIGCRYPNKENKVTIIPNYVDLNVFKQVPSKNNLARICFIGRLDQKQKNILSLLEAVKGLDVKLDIIGSGPLEKQVISESRLNSNIRLLGRVSNTQLPQYLNLCSAFILPSFYEGHPKALIEAMACGLPVIATNVPGINNIIIHNETGWLCETDSDSIREAIKTVLMDKSLCKRLGHQARQFVIKNYSFEKIVDLELSLYNSVINISETPYD